MSIPNCLRLHCRALLHACTPKRCSWPLCCYYLPPRRHTTVASPWRRTLPLHAAGDAVQVLLSAGDAVLAAHIWNNRYSQPELLRSRSNLSISASPLPTLAAASPFGTPILLVLVKIQGLRSSFLTQIRTDASFLLVKGHKGEEEDDFAVGNRKASEHLYGKAVHW